MTNWNDDKNALGRSIKTKQRIKAGLRYKLTAGNTGFWAIWSFSEKECIARGDTKEQSIESAMQQVDMVFDKIKSSKKKGKRTNKRRQK